MDFFEIMKLAKDIGFLKIANYLTRLAYLVAPFGVWFLILKLIGNSFFILNFAILGALLTVVFAVFAVTQNYFVGIYDYKIMKRIENARQMFASPDEVIAERYSEECKKILLPYLYAWPLLKAGLASIFPTTPHGRFGYTVGFVVNMYCSYSIVTLLDHNKDLFVEIFRNVSSAFGLTEMEWPIIAWGTRYWLPILVVLVILSLYYTHKLVRIVPRGAKLTMYLEGLLSTETSICLAACMITDVPTILKDSKYAVRYRPFVDPQTVPAIIQQAVHNIEGSTCNVTFYSYKLSTIEECEHVAKMFLTDRKMPRLLRFIVWFASREGRVGAQVLETANVVSPVLYLGTIENRCLFVGLIMYLPDDKVRVASFHFDNAYVRMDFVNIMKSERAKSMELIEKLPPSIESLVKRIEGK